VVLGSPEGQPKVFAGVFMLLPSLPRGGSCPDTACPTSCRLRDAVLLLPASAYDAAIAPFSKSLQLDPADVWETRRARMSQEALARSNGKASAVALLVAQSLTAVGRFEDATQMAREFLRDHASTEEAATASRWLEQLLTNGKIRSNGSGIDATSPSAPGPRYSAT